MKLVSPKPFAKKPTRFEHVANVGDGLVKRFQSLLVKLAWRMLVRHYLDPCVRFLQRSCITPRPRIGPFDAPPPNECLSRDDVLSGIWSRQPSTGFLWQVPAGSQSSWAARSYSYGRVASVIRISGISWAQAMYSLETLDYCCWLGNITE